MWNILRRPKYSGSDQQAVNEISFQTLLRLEWKRSNRSQKRFVLMLLECGNPEIVSKTAMSTVLRVLPASTRETDIVGWYKEGSIIGVIFTELGTAADSAVRSALLAKISKVLKSTLSYDQVNRIRVSLELLPVAADDVTATAPYRELLPALRYEQGASNNGVLALKATASS
jgi:hypothetical protein